MNIEGKKITIFGGNGFIGKNLISTLCKKSCMVQVVTRDNKNKNELKFLGGLGQVDVVLAQRFDQKEIREIISGTDIVINLIGILYETKKCKFNYVHTNIPKLIAEAVKDYKIKRFIHLSALGVEKNLDSQYAISKKNGELEVLKAFPDAVIIRPSVVFGKEDNFINLFSKISFFSPILPLLGTPVISYKSKYFPTIDFKSGVSFQPVYVGDLVDYIISIFGEKNKIFKIAGPNILSFKEILTMICKVKKIKRIMLPLPIFLARFIALFLEKFPKPLLTTDQVKMLENDNVSKEGQNNLEKKIKNPKSLNIMLPTYIS